MSNSEISGVEVSVSDGVCTIQINRPSKKNALAFETYDGIVEALKLADESKEVAVAIITGAGNFYSSGNDLSNFQRLDLGSDRKAVLEYSKQILIRFVDAFIEFSKPLVAAVNGPAIGIMVTVLGLCDVVYASETATFHTPFSALGQSPEGCSSYTFPKIMGYSKSNEVLLFGKKLSAQDAEKCGLVSEVLPQEGFLEEIQTRMSMVAQFPTENMRVCKNILHASCVEDLKQANRDEATLLHQRWQTKECLDAIVKFFGRKANL